MSKQYNSCSRVGLVYTLVNKLSVFSQKLLQLMYWPQLDLTSLDLSDISAL